MFSVRYYLCISGFKVLNGLDKTHDYGILSFDDHEVFELVKPSITCIKQPIIEIADRIVHNLLEQINGNFGRSGNDIVPSELVIRESTKVVNNKKI